MRGGGVINNNNLGIFYHIRFEVYNSGMNMNIGFDDRIFQES